LENIPKYFPNGGLLVIYHGRKLKITLNKHKKRVRSRSARTVYNTKNRVFRMMRGARIPDPTKGKVWYVDFLDTPC